MIPLQPGESLFSLAQHKARCSVAPKGRQVSHLRVVKCRLVLDIDLTALESWSSSGPENAKTPCRGQVLRRSCIRRWHENDIFICSTSIVIRSKSSVTGLQAISSWSLLVTPGHLGQLLWRRRWYFEATGDDPHGQGGRSVARENRGGEGAGQGIRRSSTFVTSFVTSSIVRH